MPAPAQVLDFDRYRPAEPSRRPDHLKHEGGYYILERRIWHNDSVCKNFQEAAVWAYLIGMSEHEPRKRALNGHEFAIGKDQLLTSEKRLAAYFGWSQKRLHAFLLRLVEHGRITVKIAEKPQPVGNPTATPRQRLGIIITVCNRSFYQFDKIDTQSVGNPSATHRQPNTIKGEKKVGSELHVETESNTEAPGGAATKLHLDAIYYACGKALLGKSAGGQLTKLKTTLGLGRALEEIDTAQHKENPAEYVAAIIRNQRSDNQPWGIYT